MTRITVTTCTYNSASATFIVIVLVKLKRHLITDEAARSILTADSGAEGAGGCGGEGGGGGEGDREIFLDRCRFIAFNELIRLATCTHVMSVNTVIFDLNRAYACMILYFATLVN